MAMSGLAFGQKEAKLIWESVVDTIPYYEPNSYFYDSKLIKVSTTGSSVIAYPYKKNNGEKGLLIKAFDKSGKLKWTSTDFYKNAEWNVFPISFGGGFALSADSKQLHETTFIFDEDFNYLRKQYSIVKCKDGWIEFNNDFSYSKYDSFGKQEWKYKSNENKYILFINNDAPYIGIIPENDNLSSRIVCIGKDGVLKYITEPVAYTTILSNANFTGSNINENGGWGINFRGYDKEEYFKFDKTGKVTAKVPVKSIIPENTYEKYVTVRAMNSRYMLVTYLKDKEIYFTRIDSVGNINTVKSNCILSDEKFFNPNSFFNVKILDEKDLMYNIILPQINNEVKQYKIGVIRFDNLKDSWQKQINTGTSIYNGNYYYQNSIYMEPDNTFLEISSEGDYSENKKAKIYDINGNLKWTSSFFFYTYTWSYIDGFLYFHKDGVLNKLAKIRYSDGKIMWDNAKGRVYNFYKDIFKDTQGNDVIFSEQYDPVNYSSRKVSGINADGSVKWFYDIPLEISVGHTDFGFYEGKLTYNYFIPKGDKSTMHLRKITPCEDLNTLTITGKTEACPTEKVKLSIPKQEGITYQWQKDGQDLPNVKDAVYDFGESGTYTVVAKDELCQNSVTSNALKVNIRTLPTAEVTAPKSIFCDGEKTTIASKTNGTFFQWQKDGKDIPNATTGIYEVSQAGDYRVGVRDDKCPQMGYSNIYTIITKLLPEATISTDIKGVVYEPFTVKMSANSGTGLAYQWLKDDANIPNETKATYEANKSGKYKVNVTYDGCTKLSDALTISILIPLANNEEIGEEQVKVYPNPSKGEFKIILPKTLKSADVQLFDTFGRECSLMYVGEQAQAEGLSQGVYFLRVKKGDKTVTSKLIIE